VPTNRPRHAITETPDVKYALDELRRELGDERVNLAELIVLGAREKIALLREDKTNAALRKRLADRIRNRTLFVDQEAADEVHRSGWARPEHDQPWRP
jgi:hypothetical protein